MLDDNIKFKKVPHKQSNICIEKKHLVKSHFYHFSNEFLAILDLNKWYFWSLFKENNKVFNISIK